MNKRRALPAMTDATAHIRKQARKQARTEGRLEAQTESHTDRLLAMVYAALRCGRLKRGQLPLRIARFVEAHRESPVVAELQELGLLAPLEGTGDDFPAATTSNSQRNGAKERFLDSLRSGSTFDAAWIPHLRDPSAFHKQYAFPFREHVLNVLAGMTPRRYDEVMADDLVSGVLSVCLSENECLFFDIVLETNTELLLHLLDRPELAHHLRHLRTPKIAALLAPSVPAVHLMLRHCGLPPAAQEAVLDAAIAAMNVDVAELFPGLLGLDSGTEPEQEEDPSCRMWAFPMSCDCHDPSG